MSKSSMRNSGQSSRRHATSFRILILETDGDDKFNTWKQQLNISDGEFLVKNGGQLKRCRLTS